MEKTKTETKDKEIRARESAGFIRPGTFWIVAFVFCCLEALMVQKLVLPLVPEMHGGHGLMVRKISQESSLLAS